MYQHSRKGVGHGSGEACYSLPLNLREGLKLRVREEMPSWTWWGPGRHFFLMHANGLGSGSAPNPATWANVESL